MKRIIVAALAAASAAALAAAPLPASIKIGAAESLTGDNSSYGLSIKKGLDLAVEEINSSSFLGSSKIDLIMYDEKADKQEGISVFNRLINDDKVSMIIGPTLSSTAFAADPVAQAAGVPVLGTSTTAVGITLMGDYIFRDCLPQTAFVPGPINAVAAKYKAKKAALLFESTNEYSKSEAEVFKGAIKKAGIELVGSESYQKGDSDFRTQLAKLAQKKPDFYVFASLIGEAVPVLQQAREIGITQPIVGGNGFNNPAVIKNGGRAAEGLIVGAAWSITSIEPKSLAFVKAYNAKYGANPDQFAAQAYTGLWLVATAIKNAGSADRAAIKDALGALKDVNTALGTFSFDANRDPHHSSVVLVVKNGAYVLFK